MDILEENFSERLDLMRRSIASADFIALDTEFSGLNVNDGIDGVNPFDQVEDRYQKLSHNCRRMYAF